jgi:hypothetical protein
MYLIVHNTSSDRRWISGVFQDRNNAITYLESTPPDIKPSDLREFAIDCYPVYLLEAKGIEFTLYEEADFNEYINTLKLQDDNDYFYGNVYYLEEDWKSSRAGTDWMGAIRHTHLFTQDILRIRDSGITSEFQLNSPTSD